MHQHHDRSGSVIIMVLLVLTVATMLASAFVVLMTAYRSAGTKQSARQIATQIALAGTTYGRQLIMRDHAAARNGINPIPQFYGAKEFRTNLPRGWAIPYPYAGPIPAERTGLNWLLPVEGRLSPTLETAEIETPSGSAFIISLFSFRANRYPKTLITAPGSDPTRPLLVDTIDYGHEVPLQYATWQNAWYSNNGSDLNIDDLRAYRSPFATAGGLARQRWWTVAYYDVDFQPLDWADRTLAAYEGRFVIDPIPLDGCLNIHIDEQILNAPSGGLYRLGTRLPAPSPNPNNIDLVYQVDPASDMDWTSRSLPLAQQYAASLTNMLAVMSVRDDSTTLALSTLVNIAFGQGYRGNLHGYTSSDAQHAPSQSAHIQVGTPASWRQLHANVGFDLGTGTPSDYRRVVSATSNIMPTSTFTLSPFGSGLDRRRVPFRNRPNTTGIETLADIDCPWYVNAALMTSQTARAMICSMDTAFYNSLRPMQRGDLLPIPPPKSDPVNPLKVAVWDDGVSRTGADGIEGGAMPPVAGIPKGYVPGTTTLVMADAEREVLPPNEEGKVLSTGYRRPPTMWPNASIDVRDHDDPFHESIFDVWKNPIREMCVTEYRNSPYNGTGSVARTGYGNMSPRSGNSGSYMRRVDYVSAFAVGGGGDDLQSYGDSAASAHNYYTGLIVVSGSDDAQKTARENAIIAALNTNADTVDERLSWQNDIIQALLKAMVDLRSDRTQGHKLNPDAPHGYEIIEDLETVFLAHLGISVRYIATTSHASTLAARASNYQIHHGPPAVPVPRASGSPAGGTWPLGRRNQLWALAQLTSSPDPDPEVRDNEIGYDRGRYLAGVVPFIGDLPYDANGIITSGESWTQTPDRSIINPSSSGRYMINSSTPLNHTTHRAAPGQYGFRSYRSAQWPEYNGGPYRPTWAALSRVLEHRLNDVRMSLFGTPALDFNGDGIYDATTNDGTGEVDTAAPVGTFPPPAASAPKAQLRFSSTGRLHLGQARYWRIFVKGQLWDRRGDTLVDETALEQVFVIDPDGDDDLSDSHVLFNRWQDIPRTSSHTGPSREGRTEATLP